MEKDLGITARVVQVEDGVLCAQIMIPGGQVIKEIALTDTMIQQAIAHGVSIDDSAKDVPTRGVNFIRFYRDNWLDLVRSKDGKCALSIHECGLLAKLSAFADWNTNRLVHPVFRNLLSITELAELVGIARSNLVVGLGNLKRKGMLHIVDDGQRKYVVLNPNVVFFGKWADNYEELVDLFEGGKCTYRPKVEVPYKKMKAKKKREDPKD
jgi:hypothetical protein